MRTPLVIDARNVFPRRIWILLELTTFQLVEEIRFIENSIKPNRVIFQLKSSKIMGIKCAKCEHVMTGNP